MNDTDIFPDWNNPKPKPIIIFGGSEGAESEDEL
jgi:hypothetical protein